MSCFKQSTSALHPKETNLSNSDTSKLTEVQQDAACDDHVDSLLGLNFSGLYSLLIEGVR